MDRFIPNVPGCSKYHISKNGILRKYILKEYNISTGVFYDVLRSHGIIPDRYGKKAKDSTSIPD